jgi:L-iditol 2-dehydrogenase
VQPQLYCGHCHPCRHEHYNVCENLAVLGVHTTGLSSDYFLTEAAKLIKLPDALSMDQGALIEPTAVATAGIRKCGGVEAANVVVLGAGPIGNLVAQVARASGANAVMITDINSKRLELARRCGIEVCIDSKAVRLADAISEHFGADGADLILDCAGVPQTITAAVEAARRASRIGVIANFKQSIDIELVLLQRKEVTLYGIMMYAREDFEEAIRLIAEGKLHTQELITNHFAIRQIREAYRYIDDHSDDVMKVILTLNQ